MTVPMTRQELDEWISGAVRRTNRNRSRMLDWDGGEMPIGPNTFVEVFCRDGIRRYGDAEDFKWDHIGSGRDIVLYWVPNSNLVKGDQ